MPCFRGIELSIVATSDTSIFPEFPHPDGSSARFSGFRATRPTNVEFLSPRPRKQMGEPPSADSQGHANPRISVYIPSAPDTNFYFRYAISQPPIGHKYLFFRVTMNGRNVVSWGVDLDETMAGATHQALFAPSAQYQRSYDGMLMTEYGIESRCFRFVSYGPGAKSVADDGGLVEVRVYRAKARIRKAPQPDQYRGSEKYGIANGLLEVPQTASYYDYHLVDARDSPYATFRFHYRSWENLRMLQLVPTEKPGFLCSNSAKSSPSKAAISCPEASPDYPNLDVNSQDADWWPGLCQTREKQDVAGFDFTSGTNTQNCEQSSCHLEEPYTDTATKENTTVTHEIRPLPHIPISTKAVSHGPFFPAAEDAKEDVYIEECCFQPSGDLPTVHRNSTLSSTSIDTYSEENIAVNTSKTGPATQVETDIDAKLCELALAKHDDVPNDDVFLQKDSASSDNSAVPADISSSSSSSKKSRYKMLYVAPFTDDLCKRELASFPRSSGWLRPRGYSQDVSPRSRGSPTPRRLNGGNLDSRGTLGIESHDEKERAISSHTDGRCGVAVFA